MNNPCSSYSTVGVWAGLGIYPSLLTQRLIDHGKRVVMAGIEGQTLRPLERFNGPSAVFPLGALKRTADFFLGYGARQIFLAGGIDRKTAWRYARPDLLALTLVPTALLGGDDRLLRAVAERLGRLGLEVGDPTPVLEDLLARDGLVAGPEPKQEIWMSIEAARRAARRLGSSDRGQAATALGGRVCGLEGRDGTDALLRRVPGPGAVLVKMPKPGQDRRFDLPAIGPSTIRLGKELGVAAIAVESGGVLLLERERVIEECNRAGISLVGFGPDHGSELGLQSS